ncbi:hypothetical protein U9M48_004210 [Paspalum notatum var. saurae]|uniref:Uncharacterized protein n=1 Tax=Paspalum notatum var. saurae TaxID=547442 RepID=A0AAQ3SL71_PASNO
MLLSPGNINRNVATCRRIAHKFVTLLPLVHILDSALELLYDGNSLVQGQRPPQARWDQAAQPVGLAIQVDDELDAVLHVVGEVKDLSHPGGNHGVRDVLLGAGGAEEGLHHLKLTGDEQQVALCALLQPRRLLDRCLGLGYGPLYQGPGDTKHDIRHCSSLVSCGRSLTMCFSVWYGRLCICSAAKDGTTRYIW